MSTATENSIPTYGEVLATIQDSVFSNNFISTNITKDEPRKTITNHTFPFGQNDISKYSKISFAFVHTNINTYPLMMLPIYYFNGENSIYSYIVRRNPNDIINLSLLIEISVKSTSSTSITCNVCFVKLGDDVYFSTADKDLGLQAILMR